MRRIHETFTDEEFLKLQVMKGKKTWHDFIMELVNTKAKKQIEGKL